MVETVTVVVKAGFGIEILCRETVTEETCKRAGLRDGVAKSIVGVLRYCGAGRVEVSGDVAVVVVEWDVNSTIDCDVKQAAYATCSLQRAGKVLAPIVVDCRSRAVRIGDALFYEVPIIVEESSCGFRRHLADTAGLCIVEVGQNEDAID